MNPIRRAFSEGKPAIGCWCNLASSVGAEFVGAAGYDWVLLDLQHSATTMDNLLQLTQAVLLGGSPVVVRVASNDPTEIGRALDIGAIGIIVPMVSTAAEASQAVASMRHQPRGIRSFGGIRGAQTGYSMSHNTSEDHVCVVMIETAEGLANAAQIAAVPGVDALFVGPADLALSQDRNLEGVTGMDAGSLEAITVVLDAARQHRKTGGMPTLSYEHCEELLRRGALFLTVGSDAGHVMAGARRDVEQITKWKTNGRGGGVKLRGAG